MTESFRKVEEFTFTYKTEASSQALPSRLTPAPLRWGITTSWLCKFVQMLSLPKVAPVPDHSPGNSLSFLQVTAQTSLLHVWTPPAATAIGAGIYPFTCHSRTDSKPCPWVVCLTLGRKELNDEQINERASERMNETHITVGKQLTVGRCIGSARSCQPPPQPKSRLVRGSELPFGMTNSGHGWR